MEGTYMLAHWFKWGKCHIVILYAQFLYIKNDISFKDKIIYIYTIINNYLYIKIIYI